jgi:hypothetical protein
MSKLRQNYLRIKILKTIALNLEGIYSVALLTLFRKINLVGVKMTDSFILEEFK